MSRLLAAAVLCGLGGFFIAPSSSSYAAPKGHVSTVQVMVTLSGRPLAANPNLRVRDAHTLFRLRLDPTLAPARWYTKALDRYQSQEIKYLRAQGIQLKINYRFGVLLNGFSATVPVNQLSKLRSLANVQTVSRMLRFRPLLDHSLPLVDAPQAWSVLGGSKNAGKGLYIAQLDSGIDVKNPCFSDANMAPPPSYMKRVDNAANRQFVNNKVIVARAFGGHSDQQYSAADQDGHGTFGAAIEACDYNTTTPIGSHVSGMAPDAYLMNYNIFPQNADASGEDAIVAALQAALLDGADVANLSVGSYLGAGDPSLDLWQKEIKVATASGLNVVVSAGNAGPTTQSVSTPAVSPDAIAVGASSNSHGVFSSISVSSAGIPSSLSRIKGNEGSHAFTGNIGPAQMVYVGLGRRPGDDSSAPTADDFAGKDLHGKIALIQRGTLFFETKINNAEQAGAIGAIIFDNRYEPSLFGMDVKSATLPAMSITQSDGQALLSWLNGHPDTQVTLDSTPSSFDETPNVLTDFSSVGYGPNYSIKPDLVGPGQDIYSATESEIPNSSMYNPSGFTSQSGTSFSAPHVTGAVALLLQKHPKWTPAMVKADLMDTSKSSVYVDVAKTQAPDVMQVGAGLLDIGAAVKATAYFSSAAQSFGAVDTSAGQVQRDAKLTLNDVGGGDGSWQVAVQPGRSVPGLSLSAPSSITLPAGGHADIPLHLTVSPSVSAGDYDGYVELTRGGQTLHAPYFVHVETEAIKPGSVLLVDDSNSRFASDPGTPQPTHKDVSKWYEDALAKIGKSYTYWNEAQQGTPTLQDMKRASAVIVFTGDNFGGWGANNSNQEAVLGALTATDVTILHQYMDSGGKLFVSGPGALLSDLDWTGIVLGAGVQSTSVFDNSNNDQSSKGGISPPRPSAEADTGGGPLSHAAIFAGLKKFDISTKGDGARDAVAGNSTAVASTLGEGLVGIPGLTAVDGSYGWQGTAYGQGAVILEDPKMSESGADIGITSSAEPSIDAKKQPTYRGRAVAFAFGLEAINDNTGYASREQILGRIFQWFADYPSAAVTSSSFRAGVKSKLLSRFHSSVAGVRPAVYVWEIGNHQLDMTGKTATYRFPKRGTYRIRVEVMDSLGHVALTGWKTVRVK